MTLHISITETVTLLDAFAHLDDRQFFPDVTANLSDPAGKVKFQDLPRVTILQGYLPTKQPHTSTTSSEGCPNEQGKLFFAMKLMSHDPKMIPK